MQLRKTHQTPEFPPKRVIHNTVKVLELRRAALEAYLQTLLLVEPPPRPLLDFLGVQPQKRSARGDIDRQVMSVQADRSRS